MSDRVSDGPDRKKCPSPACPQHQLNNIGERDEEWWATHSAKAFIRIWLLRCMIHDNSPALWMTSVRTNTGWDCTMICVCHACVRRYMCVQIERNIEREIGFAICIARSSSNSSAWTRTEWTCENIMCIITQARHEYKTACTRKYIRAARIRHVSIWTVCVSHSERKVCTSGAPRRN